MPRTERLLDRRGPRTDVCPGCGGERRELPPEVVADRFYCSRCERASVGPNTVAPPEPPPEPTALFSVSEIGAEQPGEDRPPVDDYDLYPMPEEEG